MPRRVPSIVVLLGLALATTVSAGPIARSPDGQAVWVVNPDADTVARLDPVTATRTGTFAVDRYPRTLAVTPDGVYVACQQADTVVRLGADGTRVGAADLGFGCAPYGVAAVPGFRVYVSCQGTGELVVLDAALAPIKRVALPWPEPRALAVGSNGNVYVTHYVTKEPNHAGHVSVVDLDLAVARVLTIAPDFETCETLGSGQGVANLLSAVAVRPGGAELWVGGTLHNSLRKGLFERSRFFAEDPRRALFPDFDFQSNPAGEQGFAHRNIYKPAFHDIARSALWRIDIVTGNPLGRLDIVGGATVADVAFAPDGATAYAVDLMTNGLYVFHSDRGRDGNPATLFGDVSAFGPGGVDPSGACTGVADGAALRPEDPYLRVPQARLVTTGGMEPRAANGGAIIDTVLEHAVVTGGAAVDTGVEYTVASGQMRPVADGVGTTPTGIALSADGTEAYVANYLARNVAIVKATPAGFGCLGAPATSCRTRADCGGAECMPLVRAVVGTVDSEPLAPEILDGKILFSTAARDAGGQGSPIPPFNALKGDGSSVQGEVTSTGRDGASLACTSCHPDFGGNDGRTWDFSQFGSSLRNTMDLRGRAGFAPGRCSNPPNLSCNGDATCTQGGDPSARCLGNPAFTPRNIDPALATTFFNPMGSTHWNGDRDEVEDFEFTFRELLGASDCDGQEHSPETCIGALVVRSARIADPADVRVDLSPQPNRGRSVRLDHLADYVYSLTSFPRNPHLGPDGAPPSAAAERGRLLFNDPVVQCSFCHNSVPGAAQQFTDKQPSPGYDPTQTPRADLNSPFLRHDVGTANLFDETNPFEIASDEHVLLGFTLFQNAQNQVPGNRSVLNGYLTSVMNDVWNTAPYLHDGSAPTLLDVVRPCLPAFGACAEAGRGRNVDDQHGRTSFLSARQLNDLVAFELAPHAPIGETVAVHGGRLDVQRLQVRFGKKAQSGSKTGKLSLVARAALPRDGSLDPGTSPLVLSVGVPAGAQMAVIEFAVPAAALHANAKKTVLRFADPRGTRAGGLRKLVLQARGTRVLLRAAAAGLDLSALRVAVPEYTVGVEVGDTTLAITRRYRPNKKGTVVKGP